MKATDRALPLELPTGLLVDGQWGPAGGELTFAVVDPGDGSILAEVPDASPADGARALDAAVAAGPAWAATAPRQRSDVLRRAFELVRERERDLATLMTLEMGKPMAESLGEVRYAADFLRWFAEEALRIDGGYRVSPDGSARTVVLRQPVGPCLLITPWNFPLAMITRKVAPALAAGCTVVLKPAEQTPLSALAMAGILLEAGAPAGVVNVVTTTRPGPLVEGLLADGRLRKLSFTGSTAVGRLLGRLAAEQVLRVSLELGGNAPFVLLEDADVDAAIEGAMLAKLRNMGEACTAANRFLVAAPLAQEFSRRLAERFEALRVGHGLEDGVEVGPLIDAASRDRVADLVAQATDLGAQLATGGASVERAGFFYSPTVLEGVPLGAALLHQEIFGPVAPVTVFDDDDEALRLANDTPFGLVAYVYCRDLRRALTFAEGLDTGMVGLNRGLVSDASAPFGGTKASGLGREGGREGILEYLETKYLAVDL
jgi:succinate-semialdehyde dehydrogenase / glutarate-semialdehyde dehydrogenase